MLGLPSFKQVVLYTGNIMHTSLTKAQQEEKTSNLELVHAIQSTLHDFSQNRSMPSYRYLPEDSVIEIPGVDHTTILDDDELQVTAKLFYTTDVLYPSDVDEAIRMLQKLLGITTIDIFVLSSFLSSSPSVTKTWKTLEGYHHQGIIHQLGVSDYSEQQLKASLENPEFAVKPAVNQVNYTFCDIPDSLKTMAAQNKVDLLYTLDSKEILSRQELTALSRENGLIQANRSISPRWVLKYDVFDEARSVVTDKGYIVVGDVE
ncbi:hypothetical protein [Absidia glauca]|uniref:GCS light chain n=1 Tax=Absidia glauca TaxID=4829 RepID=A0A163ML53_ABSGL|nr:hypothetical protein [Absidia glauca]